MPYIPQKTELIGAAIGAGAAGINRVVSIAKQYGGLHQAWQVARRDLFVKTGRDTAIGGGVGFGATLAGRKGFKLFRNRLTSRESAHAATVARREAAKQTGVRELNLPDSLKADFLSITDPQKKAAILGIDKFLRATADNSNVPNYFKEALVSAKKEFNNNQLNPKQRECLGIWWNQMVHDHRLNWQFSRIIEKQPINDEPLWLLELDKLSKELGKAIGFEKRGGSSPYAYDQFFDKAY